MALLFLVPLLRGPQTCSEISKNALVGRKFLHGGTFPGGEKALTMIALLSLWTKILTTIPNLNFLFKEKVDSPYKKTTRQ